MKNTKNIAILAAVVMLCGTWTACGKAKNDKSMNNSSAEEATEQATEAAPKPVAAQSGQAYLLFRDSQDWISYDGTDSSMLAYSAEVVTIDGNGQYTVSLTADTPEFRYSVTGKEDGIYTPSGCSVTAVVIKDGATACPNAVITIDSVTLDGEKKELTAKSYTTTVDGSLHCNVYNAAAKSPADDARSAEGALYKDNNPATPALSDVDAYAPKIVEPITFSSWTTMEVTFTVSGM